MGWHRPSLGLAWWLGIIVGTMLAVGLTYALAQEFGDAGQNNRGPGEGSVSTLGVLE